jgi:hypothetical protein
MTTEFEIVDKEHIAILKFPQTDVLSDDEEVKTRLGEINRALSLGNLEHSKLIDTTVWGVTDKNVILKQGVLIPIHRIHKLF